MYQFTEDCLTGITRIDEEHEKLFELMNRTMELLHNQILQDKYHQVMGVLEELKQYDSQDIYIVGGESVYRQMVDLCDVAHITKIDYEYAADAWFPNLDEREEWELTADSEEQTYFDLEYYFLKYEKKVKEAE